MLKILPLLKSGFVLGVCLFTSYATDFKDIQIDCKNLGCDLTFSLANANEKLPSYYQKFDEKTNTLQFGFANSSLPVQPGFQKDIAEERPFESVRVFSKQTQKGTQLTVLEFVLGKGIQGKSNGVKKISGNKIRFSWVLSNKTKKMSWSLRNSKTVVEKTNVTKVNQKVETAKSKKVEKTVETSQLKQEEKEKDSLASFLKDVNEGPKELSPSDVFYVKNEAREIVVTTKYALVYESPTLSANILDTLEFGNKYKRLKVVDDWFQIDLDGKMGFVQRSKAKYPEEISEAQQKQLKELALKMAKDQKESKAVKEELEESLAEWKNPKTLTYSSFGRRDPFIPLKNAEVDGVSIDEVRLVGIIWDDANPLIILEDVRVDGVSYTLREGDAIINGKVLKITPKEVVFQVTEFGVTRKFSMPLPEINNEGKD